MKTLGVSMSKCGSYNQLITALMASCTEAKGIENHYLETKNILEYV